MVVVIPVLILTILMWGAKTGTLGFDPLPSLEEIENPTSNLASEIITSDGKLLGKYFKENRTNIKYKDLSPYLVDALIATEDRQFYDHWGVNLSRFFKAMVKNVFTFSSHSRYCSYSV